MPDEFKGYIWKQNRAEDDVSSEQQEEIFPLHCFLPEVFFLNSSSRVFI